MTQVEIRELLNRCLRANRSPTGMQDDFVTGIMTSAKQINDAHKSELKYLLDSLELFRASLVGRLHKEIIGELDTIMLKVSNRLRD